MKAVTLALISVCCVLLNGCGDDSRGQGETVRLPELASSPVEAAFEIVVQGSGRGQGETLEPRPGQVKVNGTAQQSVDLIVHTKPIAQLDSHTLLTVYIRNRSPHGMRSASAVFESDERLLDMTETPLDPPAGTRLRIELGNIAPGGVVPIWIALPAGAPATVLATVRGDRTRFASTNSSSIAVAPDSEEVWAVVPDADVVAVVDGATGERVAQIPVAGRPVSVAISPDGAHVAVSANEANTVTIIDRATREPLAVFGEADGVGREPDHIVFTPDGGHLFVSAYVGDKITALRRTENGYIVAAQIPVGRRPTGISIPPTGDRVYVTHFLPRGPVIDNEGWVTVVNIGRLAVDREIVLRDDVNLEEAACLEQLFGVSAARLTTEGVPTQLHGVFLDPAARFGLTAGTRIGGALIVWEKGEDAVELSSFVQLREGQLSAPFIFVLDTRTSVEPGRLQMREVLDSEVDRRDYFRCIGNPTEIEFVTRDEIPSRPGEQVNRGSLVPTGLTGLDETGLIRDIAFTPSGRRALFLSGTSDEIIVRDASTLHETSARYVKLSGSNPIGIAVAPNGRRAYVNYANSMHVSVLELGQDAGSEAPLAYVPYAYREVPEYPSAGGNFLTGRRLVRDLKNLRELPSVSEVAQIELVDEDPLDARMRLGATLFDSANPAKWPTWSKSRMGSCSHCHPGGGTDGSVWGTMEGERRTMNLFGGTADRGWLHASGTHPDAREFAEVVSRERLGAEPSEEQVDALTHFVSFGIRRHQAPAVDEALAARGEELFASHCARCHQGQARTSGTVLDGNGHPALYDVGTATETAYAILPTFFQAILPETERRLLEEIRGDRTLGDGDWVQEQLDFRQRPNRARGYLKAPALTNVWQNNLLFHDGSVTDLREAVLYFDALLWLGLSDSDVTALVEYLKTL